jgi:hypothetical protein
VRLDRRLGAADDRVDFAGDHARISPFGAPRGEPANGVSIAWTSRPVVPGGRATSSGAVRWLNWAVHREKRQPAEVVAVQVGHCHRGTGARVRALGSQGGPACGVAARKQHLDIAGEVDAGLPALAAAGRIPAAREPDPHSFHID